MREAVERLYQKYSDRKRFVMSRLIEAQDMDSIRIQQMKLIQLREFTSDLEEVLKQHDPNFTSQQHPAHPE